MRWEQGCFEMAYKRLKSVPFFTYLTYFRAMFPYLIKFEAIWLDCFRSQTATGKKALLKNFQYSQENTCVGVSF